MERTVCLKHSKSAWRNSGLTLALNLLLCACAADPRFMSNTGTAASNAYTRQIQQAATLMSARVDFKYSDFYSLTSPNPNTNCAGDAKVFYDPLTLSSGIPKQLDVSLADSSTTIRPGFIKNVSVDLTDSNASVSSNLAASCSYGTGIGAPAVSHCATFDYGAIGGIPTSMGGTLLLIGGIQDYNYTGFLPTLYQASFPFRGYNVSCGPTAPAAGLVAPIGYNRCDSAMYALAVDSLPSSAATDPPNALVPGLTSASESISTWANISAAADYAGPKGAAGAVASYDIGLEKLLIFGGAAPIEGTVPTGAGVTNYDTWLFDLKTQKWSQQNSTVFIDVTQVGMWDTNGAQTYQLAKPEGARSLFGYITAQGMALQSMSTNGATVAPYAAGLPNPLSNIDLTDRVVVMGGVSLNGGLSDTHRFNPTFGPEWVDTMGTTLDIGGGALSATRPQQWMDSYHTQLTNNTYSTAGASSIYTPNYPAQGAGRSLAVAFGLVSVRDNATAKGSGYLLAAGGFDGTKAQNTPAGGCATQNQCGGMMLNRKRGAVPAAYDLTSNYSSIPNTIDSTFAQITPAFWADAPDRGGGNTVPWYGGVSMLPGFNLQTNDVVYFGGADCQQFLTNAAAPCNSFANPGRYWTLTSNPHTHMDNGGVYQSPVDGGFGATTAPQRAGMASARGTDASGNVIIVAWGGMNAAASASDQAIYYLYNPAVLPAVTPRWNSYTPPGGGPAVYGNAAMVFSHITKKFYLFGGYSPLSSTTSGDTWELSVNDIGNCGKNGNCQFSWKQLNVNGALTCYPSTCPQARRSHRIVEVNYYNRNAGGNSGGLFKVDGEPICTDSSAPCSFGIFMEGGTPDGVSVIADRWMFDPTANGGRGHWQKVGEFPPRTLSQMAAVDYFVPASNSIAHRTVMFGGETNLHSLGLTAASGSYFVAPTLGDTYIYDLDNNTWNRVTLLGKGYNLAAPLGSVGSTLSGFSEFEARQAFSVTDASANGRSQAELSPPPISGGIMVTRTMSAPTLNATSPIAPLKIPEVYLFGGRLKSGKYNTLDHVYKFCIGTSGEKPYHVDGGGVARSPSGLAVPSPDDGSCDAYDNTTNPNSSAPSANYIGRWLRKNPTGTGAGPGVIALSDFGSFMGAGAYDPVHDRILLVGGKRPRPASAAAVTDVANNSTALDPTLLAGSAVDPAIFVVEYTPPRSSNLINPQADTNGTWTPVRNCTGFATPPVGRYGHSVGYDPLNQQIIVTGGYDNTGSPLLQTNTYYDGRTYSTPEVWAAKRIDSTNAPVGFPVQVPALSTSAPCYYWTQKYTFGNSIDLPAQAPPLTGLAHAASVYIPTSGYSSGYYTMLDKACVKVGPISSGDPTQNKLLAGGAYFDIDRSLLGPSENLLLNLTFIPLGTGNQNPDASTLDQSQSAFFKVHLVKTGQPGDTLRQILQPRFLTYSDTDQYPQVAQTISVIAPPSGQIRQEQILIPISMDPAIDRIRIERYSGSGILIDASLYRMGYR